LDRFWLQGKLPKPVQESPDSEFFGLLKMGVSYCFLRGILNTRPPKTAPRDPKRVKKPLKKVPRSLPEAMKKGSGF
jgi:hypothetical protein